MQVRAKKSLGQHFLTDLSIAEKISDSLQITCFRQVGNEPVGAEVVKVVPADVLEIGPGTGVLSQFLLERGDISLKMIEIDRESVNYLLQNFQGANGRLIEGDFLKLDIGKLFVDKFCIIGNFPYNISSQIFFKILDYKDRIPQVVCMIQKEVAQRIAEPPGSKVYGILSVFLQTWYSIEYLFTVGESAFNPPPKVKSAVIRLKRNGRKELGCDENLFRTVVKAAFNHRRKTLRNSLKTLVDNTDSPVFDLRPERLSVEDFIDLTKFICNPQNRA